MLRDATDSVLGRCWNKFRKKGIRLIVRDRVRWYRLRIEVNNWFVGKGVELTGNRVRMHGLRFDVDNPLVSIRYKGTLFFGRYEIEEIALVRRYVDPGLPVVELGGSIGVVASVTNRLLQQPDRHVVVEASPVLVPTLEANRTLNGCSFVIEHAAVAYGTDAVEFPVEGHFLLSRVGGSGNSVGVRATTLGKLLDKYGFETINLISDIEGMEIELVENESEVLRDRVKTLVMETHPDIRGHDDISTMLVTLGRLGFDPLEPLTGGRPNVLAMVNRGL